MKQDELDIPVFSREQLGKGIRGRYFKHSRSGTNLVLLDDDVAAAFPTAEAVNRALRGLLALTRETAQITARVRRRTRRPRAS